MQSLKDKVIYVVGTGARKITHVSKMVKEFVNEGADVYTMMSEMGRGICDSNLDDFKIKGNTLVQGYSREGESLPLEDIVVITPCTFNTFNKIAGGIADTYPLTITATAIGAGRKIVIAPAINDAFWHHPAMEESRKKLERWGCNVIWPEITSKKVAMAPIEKILDSVYHVLSVSRYQSEQVKKTKVLDKILDSNYLEFRDTGIEMADNNLVRSSAGCISKLVDGGVLVSSSGAQVGNLGKEDLTLITEVKGESVYWMGEKSPSSETPLLYELYKANPKAKSVVHGHCPRITYDPMMQKYATSDYVRCGIFGEDKKVLSILNKNDGFAILRLHGEVVVSDSLKNSYEKLKSRLSEAHEK